VDIVTKLDTLAEYHAQKDAIELHKRELLDDVRIPADVEAVVKNGMAQFANLDRDFRPVFNEINEETEAALAKIVIPDEIKAALALIDQSRRMVNENANLRRQQAQAKIEALKIELQAQIESQTRQVYNDVAARKAEIEAEFSGAAHAVDENIRALEDEIKADTEAEGKTVKGKHFMAVYNRGRITWNTDMMEAWINDHPFLKSARKEGKPSISLRRI
jgi:hypothetical protein